MGEVLYMPRKSVGQVFAIRLRALREATGHTQNSFAAEIGLQGPAYRKYEVGRSQPSIESIVRICAVLNVSPTFLLLGHTTEQADLLAAADKRAAKHRTKPLPN